MWKKTVNECFPKPMITSWNNLFVHNQKIFGLLSFIEQATIKYWHLSSWNLYFLQKEILKPINQLKSVAIKLIISATLQRTPSRAELHISPVCLTCLWSISLLRCMHDATTYCLLFLSVCVCVCACVCICVHTGSDSLKWNINSLAAAHVLRLLVRSQLDLTLGLQRELICD